MKKDKTVGYLLLGAVAFGFLISTLFGKTGTLIMDPLMTTTQYLSQWPSLTIGSVIIQQPSSSVIILLLALVTIALGLYYLRHPKNGFAFWLGVNFILWGLGAFLAGISYQAFGYYLKCSGLAQCRYTDWIELLYMSLTVLSINAIMMAYANLIESFKTSLALKRFAICSVILYTLVQGLGMLIPVRFLLSYECLLLFLSPNLILFILLSYRNRHIRIHNQLLRLWIVFIFVNLAYFIALFANIGSFILNHTGFWFNENDTLHVLLIIWMLMWRLMIPATLALSRPADHEKEASL